MSVIDGLILLLIVTVFVRNYRKDKSDGRDLLGGVGSGGGGVRQTHQK